MDFESPRNEYTAICGATAVSVTTNLAPEDYIVNKCKWLLCVLMALTLTAGSALAQDADKPKRKKPAREKKVRVKKPKSALRGEYAIMASELKLTDEQKAKLIEVVKAQGAARKAKAAEAAPIKKELAEARKAKNKDKVKRFPVKVPLVRFIHEI